MLQEVVYTWNHYVLQLKSHKLCTNQFWHLWYGDLITWCLPHGVTEILPGCLPESRRTPLVYQKWVRKCLPRKQWNVEHERHGVYLKFLKILIVIVVIKAPLYSMCHLRFSCSNYAPPTSSYGKMRMLFLPILHAVVYKSYDPCSDSFEFHETWELTDVNHWVNRLCNHR